MNLGSQTLLDSLDGASILILRYKAQFYNGILKLYTYYKQLSANEFERSDDVKRAFESTIKPFMMLSVIEDSTRYGSPTSSPWIDVREREFLMGCVERLSI